jgi:hypothetical protein
MSRTTLPLGVRLALVARAGGRCQYPGCNDRIDIDFLTRGRTMSGVFAHIVADEPAGPRGDPVRSTLLAKSIDNLMLLCLRCHRRIDIDDVQGHPELLLLDFKRRQEDRVEHLLSIDGALRTRLLIFTAPIGERHVAIDANELRRAVLPAYPAGRDEAIDLTLLQVRDDEARYWMHLSEEVVRQVQRVTRVGPNEPQHPWSVFALAPIPLLMVLGRELGDAVPASVFQKHREPDSWCWHIEHAGGRGITVHSPSDAGADTDGDVALLLSISAVVDRRVVGETLGREIPTWEITAADPGVAFVRTARQLAELAMIFRNVLTAIRAKHGETRVHLFPAIPNSVAVEFGRRLLPKADPALAVYDFNRKLNGFAFALDLLTG